MGNFKKVIKTSEYFLDIEKQISSSGGLSRGFYTRKLVGNDGAEDEVKIIWLDHRGTNVTDYGYGEKLEKLYQDAKL